MGTIVQCKTNTRGSTLRIFTYVDNSNVFIEGQKVSAVKKGMSRDIYRASQDGICDLNWNIDYGRLHQIVCGDRNEMGAAKLWGSPPPSDSFWEMVSSYKFQVKTYEKGFDGKEKKVDVAIAHQITKDAYSGAIQKDDEIVLVSGDKDYIPVVEDLRKEGFKFSVIFWDHAANELKDAAESFSSLNPHVEYLNYNRSTE